MAEPTGMAGPTHTPARTPAYPLVPPPTYTQVTAHPPRALLDQRDALDRRTPLVPPPSYPQATTSDWPELVVPYVPVCDWPNLCLVSKHFWGLFAPGLWKDPIATVRTIRQQTSRPPPDPSWFRSRFVAHVNRVRAREDVRALVLMVELGYGDDLGSLGGFPNVRAILCARAGAEPCQPSQPEPHRSMRPLLFSQEFRSFRKLGNFGALRQHVVCLDLANLESCPSISAPIFPALRIMKLRNMDLRAREGTPDLIEDLLGKRPAQFKIWSLDVSQNDLDDSFLAHLQRDFPAKRLQHTDPTHREGRIASNGALIHELPASPRFFPSILLQPDVPEYTREQPDQQAEPPLYPTFHLPKMRMTGLEAIREDDVESIRAKLCGEPFSAAPTHLDLQILDISLGVGSITHLHLNQNAFSARAICQLIAKSGGRLEHLDCDTMVFTSPRGLKPFPLMPFPPSVSPKTTLSGILNAAHLIRPVFSSNLQVLRIHHSLVTQVLTLHHDKKAIPSKEDCWLAETFLLARAKSVFPDGAFQLNTNPRLRSLTLTRIPRYSKGPIIQAITDLIDAAALQEERIQAAKARGLTVLPGLRRIQLEFDPKEIESKKGEEPDMDNRYSFFADSTWTPSPSPPVQAEPSANRIRMSDIRHVRGGQNAYEMVNITVDHRGALGVVEVDGCGSLEKIPQTLVWIGPHVRQPHIEMLRQATSRAAADVARAVGAAGGVASAGAANAAGSLGGPSHPGTTAVATTTAGNCSGGDANTGTAIAPTATAAAAVAIAPAIRRYLNTLAEQGGAVRQIIEPATASHARAGVPAGEFVYSQAWNSMMFWDERYPEEERPRRPEKSDLDDMYDVKDAITHHRLLCRQPDIKCEQTCELPGHWSGEVRRHWSGDVQLIS